jgi:hypothetical protein
MFQIMACIADKYEKIYFRRPQNVRGRPFKVYLTLATEF